MNSSGRSMWDVIIVGGGGSGLAACVSCAERGLKTLLLEKRPQLGSCIRPPNSMSKVVMPAERKFTCRFDPSNRVLL